MEITPQDNFPGFNEKNNVLVWAEACKQAQGMLRKWTAPGVETIMEVPADTMRVTLHIISKIGFGVGLLWPGEKPSQKQYATDAIYSSSEPLEGHTMSFENVLETLLEHLILTLLLPKWILSKSARIGQYPRLANFRRTSSNQSFSSGV